MPLSPLPCGQTPEGFAHPHLIANAAYRWPAYAGAAHHRLIARRLDAVERGECIRPTIPMRLDTGENTPTNED